MDLELDRDRRDRRLGPGQTEPGLELGQTVLGPEKTGSGLNRDRWDGARREQIVGLGQTESEGQDWTEKTESDGTGSGTGLHGNGTDGVMDFCRRIISSVMCDGYHKIWTFIVIDSLLFDLLQYDFSINLYDNQFDLFHLTYFLLWKNLLHVMFSVLNFIFFFVL